MTDNKLTHFDASGNAVMVDVSEKTVTFREATAHGIITMNAEAFAAVESGTVKKGDVLGVARIAGIMATKRTSELIPLCHPLPLTKVSVDFRLLPERQAVEALCTVKTAGVTGVEMEALTGVSTALLTIYDMCKACLLYTSVRPAAYILRVASASGEVSDTFHCAGSKSSAAAGCSSAAPAAA